MELSESLYWPTMKILLTAASPIQSLVTKDCVTHSFINQRAIEILYNDDRRAYARLTDRYLDDLNKGADWADTKCKNLSHFFIPQLQRGFGKFSNGALECEFYFRKALKYWERGRVDKAFFYLGASAHLVQDLCVPHHARGILLDGHQEFEDWAEANRGQYLLHNGGIYGLGDKPAEWVINNALAAEKLFDFVRLDSTEDDYDYASDILLTRAQRTTAGFISLFLNRIKDKKVS